MSRQHQQVRKGHCSLAAKKYYNIVGRQFGMLIVFAEVLPEHKNEQRPHLCICDCGEWTVVSLNSLTTYNTQSCGCLLSKTRKDGSRKKTTHGETRNGRQSREYVSWYCMKTRCLNSNADEYSNYGGRGIKICERWLNFENFLADMGRKPGRGYTLERKDTEGNYEPENCKWATSTEQVRNRRTTKRITYKGEDRPLAEWATIKSIPYGTLSARIKADWSLERAMESPVRAGHKESI